MATMHKYFDYDMVMAGCGITKVHFKGFPEDWAKLIE